MHDFAYFPTTVNTIFETNIFLNLFKFLWYIHIRQLGSHIYFSCFVCIGIWIRIKIVKLLHNLLDCSLEFPLLYHYYLTFLITVLLLLLLFFGRHYLYINKWEERIKLALNTNQKYRRKSSQMNTLRFLITLCSNYSIKYLVVNK